MTGPSRPAPARGDVVWLDFRPTVGSEQSGRRPAVVVSPWSYNSRVGLALVCPITSQQKGYPFEVTVDDRAPVEGVVLSDQVRSVDWRARQVEIVGSVSDEVLAEIVERLAALLHWGRGDSAGSYTASMLATAYPHLVYDDQGRLRIEGAGYKALILLETYLAQGWTVDQFLDEYPALTRGQAHSLLAYYYDNKRELDELIARRDEEFEATRAASEDPVLQSRLAAARDEWLARREATASGSSDSGS